MADRRTSQLRDAYSSARISPPVRGRPSLFVPQLGASYVSSNRRLVRLKRRSPHFKCGMGVFAMTSYGVGLRIMVRG